MQPVPSSTMIEDQDLTKNSQQSSDHLVLSTILYPSLKERQLQDGWL